MDLEEKKLTIPKTTFSMKAGLPDLEKAIIKFWQDAKVRDKIARSHADCPKFTFFFGPPYANGNFHMGHGLNVFLKDIILRSFSLLGYNISNLTGHDCHGLPIELAVKKELNKSPDSIEDFLLACEEFAERHIKIQQNSLQRMGILQEDGAYYATYECVQEIYGVFSQLLLNNYVYLDKKPCPWSISEKTVISDAEIVYRTKVSKTVDLALEITDSTIENFKGKFVCVWTTTPWTLIDNVAVAFNKNFNYLLCEADEKVLIISEGVQESFQERTGIELNVLGIISGELFEGMYCMHPLLEKSVPLIHSDHVESESGTGFVHIAPAHGLEDFELCKIYDIELIESVDDSGFYYETTPLLGGLHIFANQEKIFDALEGKILCISSIEHEYPFDTRGGDISFEGEVVSRGTPLIYRATEQVFIDIHQIDKIQLKNDLDKILTVPESLKKSIFDTLEKRQEWCVSRNRAWGVPVAIFVEKNSGEILIDQKLQDKIIEKIQTNRAFFLKDSCLDILQEVDENPADYVAKIFILDVWFDSGCVPFFLAQKYFDKHTDFEVADLIIEGKDQVRGWFQSTLLLSYLIKNKLPYKSIVSHGFVVDELGNKMSKSKGNVIDLQETMDQYGSEILRLWVMTADFTNDVAVGPGILNKCSETYRKIRNVMRFLISIVESNQLMEHFSLNNFHFLERAILNELDMMKNQYIEHLKKHHLRLAFDTIFLFIHRLSELYFNARKDTIYCDSLNSEERISAIQCAYILLEVLTILLTPVLPTTSEEIFQHIKGFLAKEQTSVHEFCIQHIKIPTFPEVEISSLETLLEKIRKIMEDAKQKGEFNKNSDVVVFVHEIILQPLDVVASLLGVSDVRVSDTPGIYIEILTVEPCARCGKRSGNLCTRCAKCF